MSKIICEKCGEEKVYHCKNMCKQCYMKLWREKNPNYNNNRKEYFNKYYQNNKIRLHQKYINNIEKYKQYYIDHAKHQKQHRYDTGQATPMNEDKTCSCYLGCYIAEPALISLFKNVQRMPTGFRGYDFKCSNGYLIDSKASCKRIRKNKSNGWGFNIRKNKIADYFLCIAFDNRKNIKAKYIWLIPGDVINDKTYLTISESKINKWDEYKLDKLEEINNFVQKIKNGDLDE